MDVNKFKVAELRIMLSGRGLDMKGTKQELVKRLNEAMLNDAVEEENAQQDAVPDDGEKNDQENMNDVEVEVAPNKQNAEASPSSEQLTSATSQLVTSARGKRKLDEDQVPYVDEPAIEEGACCLDWYDSDLHMKIDKSNMIVGVPLVSQGWGYIWAGARANVGFLSGKVCFEVKLLEELSDNECKEIRVGWSTNDTNLLLGEANTSFAYCSKSGKIRQDNEFKEYGKTFGKGDVVGVYLDATDRSSVKVTYTLNGESQGEAFNVPLVQMDGHALFPHVSSKYFKFEVNFGKNVVSETTVAGNVTKYMVKAGGSEKEPWFSALDGYKFVATLFEGVANCQQIQKREDCELIMMIGLPGSGKSTWVNNFVAEHPGKRYNVLGLNSLIEKMEVDGKPIMNTLEDDGKWKDMVHKLFRCVNKQLDFAKQRHRNFILDQTNVYSRSHSFKVGAFKGMSLKAVVVVPSDDVYQSRLEAQKKSAADQAQYMSSEDAIMEMKAGITLPTADESLFKEIEFVELQREEATKLIEKYNQEALGKGFGKRREQLKNRPSKKIRKTPEPPNIKGNNQNRKQRSLQQAQILGHLQMVQQARMMQALQNSLKVQNAQYNVANQLALNQMLAAQMMNRGGYNGVGMNFRRF